MGSANESWLYIVTSTLIGWAYIHNDPSNCINICIYIYVCVYMYDISHLFFLIIILLCIQQWICFSSYNSMTTLWRGNTFRITGPFVPSVQ